MKPSEAILRALEKAEKNGDTNLAEHYTNLLHFSLKNERESDAQNRRILRNAYLKIYGLMFAIVLTLCVLLSWFINLFQ